MDTHGVEPTLPGEGLATALQECFEIGCTVGAMTAARDGAHEDASRRIADEQCRYDTILAIARGGDKRCCHE